MKRANGNGKSAYAPTARPDETIEPQSARAVDVKKNHANKNAKTTKRAADAKPASASQSKK